MQTAPETVPAACPPVAFESSFTRKARRFYRWYRNSPIAVGHSLIRRGLSTLIPRHQQVVLRSGLKLEVNLDQAVQHTIFWYDGDMEPQLSWAVREFLPVGGRMIDCGANCGFIGLEARMHKQARVIMIEPHPGLAATIRQNIALNGWADSCKAIEAAASDSTGTVSLHVCEVYDGSHSLHSDWVASIPNKPIVEVPMITLGQIMDSEPGFDRVDFLKVDTEGNDYRVLRGLGDRLIPERITVLYMELARERDVAYSLLEERGYSGFGYPGHLNGVQLRNAARRAAEGEPVALFRPRHQCASHAETLWCRKGGPQEARLLELAARWVG